MANAAIRAGIFATDKSNYLSEPATEWGEQRLKECNPTWAERYGGGWVEVETLVGASREHWEQAKEKEARRQAEIETERVLRGAARSRSRRLRKPRSGAGGSQSWL